MSGSGDEKLMNQKTLCLMAASSLPELLTAGWFGDPQHSHSNEREHSIHSEKDLESNHQIAEHGGGCCKRGNFQQQQKNPNLDCVCHTISILWQKMFNNYSF